MPFQNPPGSQSRLIRAGVNPRATDKEGAPVVLTVLEASSSRLIALVGMIVILLIYLAFEVFALFAPYVANKVSGILQQVLGSKPLPAQETAGTGAAPVDFAGPSPKTIGEPETHPSIGNKVPAGDPYGSCDLVNGGWYLTCRP